MESPLTSEGLPVWIGLARWFVLPGYACVATWVFARVFGWIFVPRAPSEPSAWPENAVALQRAATAPGLALAVTTMQLGFVLADQVFEWGASFPRPLVGLILLGMVLTLWVEQRRLLALHGGLAYGRRSFLRQKLAWILIARWPVWWSLMFVLGSPGAGSSGRWAFLAAGVVLYVALFLGLGLRLASAAGWLRPPSAELEAANARVAERAGLAPPRVRVLEVSTPNAFFLPLQSEILVTRGALAVFAPDELEGVLAHELGHLTEGRRFLVAYLPVHAAFLGLLAAVTLLHGTAALAGILVCLALVIGMRFLLPNFLRAAEERADAFARRHSAPGSFSRALEVLHREGRIPPKLGKHASHPDLARRLEAGGDRPSETPLETPPRPRLRFLVTFLLASTLAAGVRDSVMRSADELSVPRLALALRGAEPHSVAALAGDEEQSGRDTLALRLYHGGGELEPENPWWPMQEARLLAHRGRCAEARARFDEAERLCRASGEFDCESWLAESREVLAECP